MTGAGERPRAEGGRTVDSNIALAIAVWSGYFFVGAGVFLALIHRALTSEERAPW